MFSASVVPTLRLLKLARTNGMSLADLSALRPLAETGDVAELRSFAMSYAERLNEIIRVLHRRRRTLKSLAACACTNLHACKELSDYSTHVAR